MRRLTLAEIAESVGAVPHDQAAGSLIIQRVSTDSRDIRIGDLFWAIAGERFDGHEFVSQAIAAGAVAAVVRHGFRFTARAGTPGEFVGHDGNLSVAPLLRVADTRIALGEFAAWYRRQCPTIAIGVTGSVGKTSAREAIYAVLGRRFSGIRSLRNFNNDIGVPLSLLELEPQHSFAVIEMGASAPGEIAGLAAIVQPRIGVLTAVGAAHLQGFGSIDGVQQAKAELIAALQDAGGVAVLNADDARVQAIGEAASCGVIWYGTRSGTYGLFARAQKIEPQGDCVSFRMESGPYVRLHAPGRHQVYAALAGIALGRWMGLADREILAGLESYRPGAMRCQVERLGGVTVINDCYNACPPSMWAALRMLESWPTAGRRVLVCGDMKELGDAAEAYHRRLGEAIARGRSVDLCVAVGPLSRNVVEAARQAGMSAESIFGCNSPDQAIIWLRQVLLANDVVLVKASRAMQLELVVLGLRERFAA